MSIYRKFKRKALTERQKNMEILKDNPNIIPLKGSTKRIFEDVEHLVCVECDKEFSFNTKEKFYLLNAHGWGICEDCMPRYKE